MTGDFLVAIIMIAMLGAFVGVGILALKLQSMGLWSRYAERYSATAEPPPAARRLRRQSLIFKTGKSLVEYGRSIDAWVDTGGVYLRPNALRRMFHPMLFLRFDQMEVLYEHGRFHERVEVRMPGDLPMFVASGPLGTAIAEKSGYGAAADRPAEFDRISSRQEMDR
jgi:hypothetical protein